MQAKNLQVLDSDSLLTLHYKISHNPELLITSDNNIAPFEILADLFELKLTDSTYSFVEDSQLILPKGKSWRGENGNGDRENCEIVFNALPGLSAAEATDERLWVTLSFNQFSEYTAARWPISPPKGGKDHKKVLSNAILEHRFAGGSRARWRNNSISRLWWMAYYAHSFGDLSPDSILDIICLDSDLVGNLMGRPWTANNRVVARCLLDELHKEYFRPNAPDFSRERFRNTLKELDLRAGKYVLAALETSQIENLVASVFRSHHC